VGAQRARGYNAKGEIFGPTLEFFGKGSFSEIIILNLQILLLL